MLIFLRSNLSRYIGKQILFTTGVICLILTFILWLTQSLRLLELIVGGGAPMDVFGYLLVLAVPKFLEISIPISLAIAVIFTLNRLVTDSEWVICRNAGLSYRALFIPIGCVGMFCAMIVFVLSAWLTPLSNQELDRMRDIIKSDYSSVLLQDGVFNSIGDNLTIYIADRQQQRHLKGVIIHSSREAGPPTTILAERGELLSRDGDPHVVVYDGVRQQFNPRTQSLETLNFSNYSINIASLSQTTINAWVDEGERSLWTLLSDVRDPNLRENFKRAFWAEIHYRLSRPFLTLSLAALVYALLFSGHYTRRGMGRKILIATIGLILTQGLYLAAVNWATSGLAGIIILYAIAIAPLPTAWLLLRRYDTTHLSSSSYTTQEASA